MIILMLLPFELELLEPLELLFEFERELLCELLILLLLLLLPALFCKLLAGDLLLKDSELLIEVLW